MRYVHSRLGEEGHRDSEAAPAPGTTADGAAAASAVTAAGAGAAGAAAAAASVAPSPTGAAVAVSSSPAHVSTADVIMAPASAPSSQLAAEVMSAAQEQMQVDLPAPCCPSMCNYFSVPCRLRPGAQGEGEGGHCGITRGGTENVSDPLVFGSVEPAPLRSPFKQAQGEGTGECHSRGLRERERGAQVDHPQAHASASSPAGPAVQGKSSGKAKGKGKLQERQAERKHSRGGRKKSHGSLDGERLASLSRQHQLHLESLKLPGMLCEHMRPSLPVLLSSSAAVFRRERRGNGEEGEEDKVGGGEDEEKGGVQRRLSMPVQRGTQVNAQEEVAVHRTKSALQERGATAGEHGLQQAGVQQELGRVGDSLRRHSGEAGQQAQAVLRALQQEEAGPHSGRQHFSSAALFPPPSCGYQPESQPDRLGDRSQQPTQAPAGADVDSSKHYQQQAVLAAAREAVTAAQAGLTAAQGRVVAGLSSIAGEEAPPQSELEGKLRQVLEHHTSLKKKQGPSLPAGPAGAEDRRWAVQSQASMSEDASTSVASYLAGGTRGWESGSWVKEGRLCLEAGSSSTSHSMQESAAQATATTVLADRVAGLLLMQACRLRDGSGEMGRQVQHEMGSGGIQQQGDAAECRLKQQLQRLRAPKGDEWNKQASFDQWKVTGSQNDTTIAHSREPQQEEDVLDLSLRL